MPALSLGHKPDLTIEKALKILETAFGSKYKVYTTKTIGSDIIIKKSAWSGIAIKIVQKEKETKIRFGAIAPSFFVRLLQLGLIPLLILYYTSWKKMQNEVKIFIESSPDFK